MATMTKPTDEPPAVSPVVRASSSAYSVDELKAALPEVPVTAPVVEAPAAVDAPAVLPRALDEPVEGPSTAPAIEPLKELGPDAERVSYPPSLLDSEPMLAPVPTAQDVYPLKTWSHFEVKETPKVTARILCSALTSMGIAFEFNPAKWEYHCVRTYPKSDEGEALVPDLEFKILLLEKDVVVVVEAVRGKESDAFKFYQTVSILMARVRGGGAEVTPPTYREFLMATSPKAVTGGMDDFAIDLLEGLEEDVDGLSRFDIDPPTPTK